MAKLLSTDWARKLDCFRKRFLFVNICLQVLPSVDLLSNLPLPEESALHSQTTLSVPPSPKGVFVLDFWPRHQAFCFEHDALD